LARRRKSTPTYDQLQTRKVWNAAKGILQRDTRIERRSSLPRSAEAEPAGRREAMREIAEAIILSQKKVFGERTPRGGKCRKRPAEQGS